MNELTMEQIEEIMFLLDNDEVVSREEIRSLLEAARCWLIAVSATPNEAACLVDAEVRKKCSALEAQVRELKALVEEAGPFMRGTIPEHEDCGCASCLWLVRARKAMNS